MEQKRIKVRLTENSPYSDYGYYEKGDIGYIDGYVNNNAVIILENGKFAKADLRCIEVVNEEDKMFHGLKDEDERIRKELIKVFKSIKSPIWFGLNIVDIIAWLEKQCEHKPAYTKEYDFHGIKFIPKFKEGDVIRDKKRGETTTIRDFSYDTGLYTHTYGQFPITIQDDYEKIKPIAWSEEDESTRKALSNLIGMYYLGCTEKIGRDRLLNWLNSLEGRVQPKMKQEWSKDDYNFIKELCDLLASISKDGYVGKYYTVDLVEKLKSLRPQNRWKPSEEMLEALYRTIPQDVMEKSEDEILLDKLYQGLKYGKILSK